MVYKLKVTIRSVDGGLAVYIPRKDLEVNIVVKDPEHVFGGTVELEGGMKLYIEPMNDIPKLPLTLNARKVV